MSPVVVFLGIGSNLGNRQLNIERAIQYLKDTSAIFIAEQSSIYQTIPEGGPENQPEFLNAVIKINTLLTPFKLLERLKGIELLLRRKFCSTKWAPRTIDLDILFYGDLIFASKDLVIPHPLLHKRYFVLKPLCEIAPNLVHPLIGKSISQLLRELKR